MNPQPGVSLRRLAFAGLVVLTIMLPLAPSAGAFHGSSVPCWAYTWGSTSGGQGILYPGQTAWWGFAFAKNDNFLFDVRVQGTFNVGTNGGFAEWEWIRGDGATYWGGWVKNYWSNTFWTNPFPHEYACFALKNSTNPPEPIVYSVEIYRP